MWIQMMRFKLNHLYLLLCPISMICLSLFTDKFGKIFGKEGTDHKANIFIIPLLYCLGHALFGILWYIQVKKGFIKSDEEIEAKVEEIEMIVLNDEKTIEHLRTHYSSFDAKEQLNYTMTSKKSVINKNQIEINRELLKKQKKHLKIKYYCVIITLNTFAIFCENFMFDYVNASKNGVETKSDRNSTNTVAVNKSWLFPVFSSVFLSKSKLYKHHYLALIIITISMTIKLVLFNVLNTGNNYMGKFTWPNLVLINLSSCIYAMVDTLYKKYSLKSLESPYKIITFMGIFGLPLGLLFQVFFFFVHCPNDTYYYCNSKNKFAMLWENINFDGKFVFFCLGMIVLVFLQTFMIFTIILLYSPNIYVSCALLFHFAYPMFNLKAGEKYAQNIAIHCVSYIFILLGNFIFNEFIILNFCGLSYNTHSKIDQRQKEETDDDLSDGSDKNTDDDGDSTHSLESGENKIISLL